jgi:hypothetical protein
MKILCIGDIAIAAPVSPWLIPGNIIPGKDEKILFNWELPIGTTLNPVPRTSGPRLLSHPGSVNILEKWSPGFAALATNHIMDSGEEGLKTTIELLHQAGFQTVGAGQTVDEIQKPLLWETDEGKLGIVNWVFRETNPEWNAVPGPNCWPGVDTARQIIHDLKERVDWVLVFAHWSDELFPFPSPEDRYIANELANMGVDMVVGHHPHVIRGMETIGTCTVIYSIGNFFFSDYINLESGWDFHQAPRNRESLGVEVSFSQGRQPELNILSFWHANGEVISDPLHRAERRMKSVSYPFQSFTDAKYAEWHTGRQARFNRWEYRINFRIPMLGFRGFVRFLSQKVNKFVSSS